MIEGIADSRQRSHQSSLDGVDADRINVVFIRVAFLHRRGHADDEMGESGLCQEKLCMASVRLFLVFLIFVYFFDYRHHGKCKARSFLFFIVEAAYKCLGIDIHLHQIFFTEFC